MMPMRWISGVICAALICGGCGKSTTDSDERQVPAGAGKIPAGFPKDVPLYGGAVVTMAQTGAQQHLFNVVLASQDDIGKITDYYKRSLETNGWTIENTMTSEPMSAFTAVKDHRRLILQIVAQGGGRTINLTVSDKP